jgi:CubicO group peptidase (beta-lactamase class C family)
MKNPIVYLFFFIAFVGFGQHLPKIDALIAKELSSQQVPSLAVAVIDAGKLVHLSTNGYKDWDQKLPADTHTAFQIASVSKIVTNLAIFKLVEAQKIDLDADINKYLPFAIQNPHFPDDTITVGELLNHRSGIRDDYKIYGPLWSIPNGDSEIKLGDFLKDYLHKDGKLYSDTHFDNSASYKAFKYCNTGYALLGLIVESVAKIDYEAYCQKEIFKPLQMKNTSWFLTNLPLEKVAQPYILNNTKELIFKGHNGYPDYPAGQLRTSVSDFSKLLLGYLHAENGDFILNKKTVDAITPSPQIAHTGYYTWFLNAMQNHLYYSHEGGDTGVKTVVMMDVTTKNAILIFANASYKLGTLLKSIEHTMWGN